MLNEVPGEGTGYICNGLSFHQHGKLIEMHVLNDFEQMSIKKNSVNLISVDEM